MAHFAVMISSSEANNGYKNPEQCRCGSASSAIIWIL